MVLEENDFVPRDARIAQEWHARIARTSVVKVVVALAVLLGLVAQVQLFVDARMRRARLLARGQEFRARAPNATSALDVIDRATLALAGDPWRGETRARIDFTRPSLYLRAVVDEVGTGREIHHVMRASRKDVLIACLLRPPVDRSASALHAAAIRYRWRVDLDELAPMTFDLDVLAPAIPGSRTFLDEVRATSDATTLRLLELEDVSAMLPRTRFELGIVALDELPTGFAMPEGVALADAIRASRLDDIVALPHVMRVGVVDLASGALLSKVRVAVDAWDLRIPSAIADAEEIHACQAAVALAPAP